MPDREKVATLWQDDELDAIVTDYFSMLEAELSGRPYVKSRHSATLMGRIGRSHRSVEFKHQNISAVLDELGLPWIWGYKPKRNYQATIFDAIDRYLSAHPDALTRLEPRSTAPDLGAEQIFVDQPALFERPKRPHRLADLVRKFDPAERDQRNRSLGKAGEEFVLRVERKRLLQSDRPDLARKIRWVAAEEGDGAGFDILSFEKSGHERAIEVKTTNGSARTPFFLTANEYKIASQRSDSWRLYRVHLFAQSPRIFTLAPPLGREVHLDVHVWRASFV
jgi:hypothetical protein